MSLGCSYCPWGVHSLVERQNTHKMKLDSDHSNQWDKGWGKEVSYEVAGAMEDFWKAWHLNLLFSK